MFLSENRLTATITDQLGVPLKVVDFDMIAEENATVYKYMFEPLGTDVQSVAVQFYYEPSIFEPKEIKKALTQKLPQRISFGKMGELVVTNVVKEGNLHTMRLKVDSDFAFDDTFSQSGIDIQNRAGESLVTDYIHAVGPNEYELTYQHVSDDVYVRLLKMPKLKVIERFELLVD